jgi:hypothetical protein
MPDYNLGHDEKTIIFILLCEPRAHVDSRLSGIFLLFSWLRLSEERFWPSQNDKDAEIFNLLTPPPF